MIMLTIIIVTTVFTGILCFIVLHRYCVFLQIEGLW